MTTTENTLEVANNIRAQIGNRALLMMGARNLVGSENSLSFQIGGCPQVSHIKVTLEPSDTYKVEFFKIRGTNIKTVHTSEMIYADGLCQCIEVNTGLLLSL